MKFPTTKTISFISSLLVGCQLYAYSDTSYTVMAAGGSLKTCSSLSLNNCLDTISSNDYQKYKTQELYLVTESGVKHILDNSYWQVKQSAVSELASLLSNFMEKHTTPLSRREFTRAIRDFSAEGEQFYQSLSDYDWFMLLDSLQVPQINNGARLKEKVFFDYNKYGASSEIYRSFVAMAQKVAKDKKVKPVILVMTSSARDPFDAVDFYVDIFAQAGAETIWLPIDQALQTALANNQCENLTDFHAKLTGTVRREGVYPDLVEYQMSHCQSPDQLTALINSANGIFINGGDQSLTRAALIPDSDSGFMQLIRKRVAKGELVVGGTSAGAAVQSGVSFAGKRVPMITSGRSEDAIISGGFARIPPAVGCTKNNSCNGIPENALTYNASGGLGLINTGIIDTHFSERARQIRLIQLAAQTQSSIAVGVDETTAVMISESQNHIEYKVIGQNGAWFFTNASLTKKAGCRKSITTEAHYLRHRDILKLDKTSLKTSISFANNPVNVSHKASKNDDKNFFRRDNFRQFTNTIGPINSAVNLQSIVDTNKISLELKPNSNYQINPAPLGQSISVQPVSFSDLRLSVQVCTDD